jgi:hypothetical protein
MEVSAAMPAAGATGASAGREAEAIPSATAPNSCSSACSPGGPPTV